MLIIILLLTITFLILITLSCILSYLYVKRQLIILKNLNDQKDSIISKLCLNHLTNQPTPEFYKMVDEINNLSSVIRRCIDNSLNSTERDKPFIF